MARPAGGQSLSASWSKPVLTRPDPPARSCPAAGGAVKTATLRRTTTVFRTKTTTVTRPPRLFANDIESPLDGISEAAQPDANAYALPPPAEPAVHRHLVRNNAVPACRTCPAGIKLAKYNPARPQGSPCCPRRTLTRTSFVTRTSFRTKTVTAATPAAGSIHRTLERIASGAIQKTYHVDRILSLINLTPPVRDILQGRNPSYPNVTFFAVTNEGWGFSPVGRLMERTVSEPTAEQHPGDVLRYQIVQAYIEPSRLPGKVLAPTLLNSSFTLARLDPQYLVLTRSSLGVFPFFGFDNSTVIDSIPASNGMILVTRSMVIPPVWPTTTMTKANLTSFRSLLEAAGLAETANSYGLPDQPGATFFVPVNRAFASMEAVQALQGKTPEQLAMIAETMIVISGRGVYYSSDLTDGLELQAVNGQVLKVTVVQGTALVNGANVIIKDILVHNGVIHVIDALLLPSVRRNPLPLVAADEVAADEVGSALSGTATKLGPSLGS
ncbi:FAS1 domain-containing protein [Hyaloraphidium curvatum]|nr:FAS1 domain-containing protein [Hyaloraphidium curvatum]